jgi:hypothetical protein
MLDRGRFAPRLNDSNKLFSTEQGQPREGGSSYGPFPPLTSLSIPQYPTYKSIEIFTAKTNILKY